MFDKNPLVNLGRIIVLLLILTVGFKWMLPILFVMLIPIGIVGAVIGLFSSKKG